MMGRAKNPSRSAELASIGSYVTYIIAGTPLEASESARSMAAQLKDGVRWCIPNNQAGMVRYFMDEVVGQRVNLPTESTAFFAELDGRCAGGRRPPPAGL